MRRRIRSIALDLIPDFIPIFGYLDDLIILPLGIVAVVKLIPRIMADHRAAAAIASGPSLPGARYRPSPR
jgi:uncharacterized membrane protein YkvA (DUF1232 family)